MTEFNLNQIKSQLGEKTTKFENQFLKTWNEFSPHYTNLEPWQRGIILISLLALLVFTIYYLTHESKDLKAQRKAKQESELEARLIKRMEVLKKLRE